MYLQAPLPAPGQPTWPVRVGSRQSPALVQQLVIRPQAPAASHARAGASTVAFMELVQPSTGIVAPGSLRVSTAATSPAGQASPTGGRVYATAAATSHFDLGQCTWWADQKRPDIYKAAVAHGVPTGSANAPYPWDAWRWAQNARVGGLPVGSVPKPGAIAVFPQGSWQSSVGHVAYVESVSQNSYVISEENFGGGEYVGGHADGDDPDPRLRTIYTSGHADDPNLNPPGTEFIYRMPASGPTAAAPQGPTTAAPRATPTPVPAITPRTVRGYNKYANSRYGFTTLWPSSFRAQPPPADGDGQTWTSPDGQVLLSAYGANNIFNYSPGQDEAMDARSMSVVYDNINGNVVTVSGYKDSGRTIVYQRDVVGPGAIDTLYWSYPASQKVRWDAEVMLTARTFQSGDITTGH